MILQVDFMEFNILSPLIEVLLIGILLLLMLYIFFKKENPMFITVIFSFSLIIGFISIQNFQIPFSPYIQFLFILLQTLIFVKTMFDYFNEYKKLKSE